MLMENYDFLFKIDEREYHKKTIFENKRRFIFAFLNALAVLTLSYFVTRPTLQ